jgi:tetratricopeptide (TPR) repeat protein
MWWQYLFPVAALLVVGAAWALRERIGRGLVTGLLYFGGTLFPVLGFFNVYPFKFSFVADHFQYLPSLGILTMVAWGVATVLERAGAWRKPSGLVACGVLLVVLGGLSFRQARIYEDAETLWIDTTTRSPTSFMAFSNLGYEYSRMGRLEEAEKAYSSAIAAKPDFDQAYFNLARLHGKQGRGERAIEMYRRAIELRPDYTDAYLNLGIELGRLGRYVEAISAFEAAIRASPDFAEAHYNLGVTLARIGRLENAATALESALDLRSGYPEARLGLGATYRRLGRLEDAVAELRLLLDSDPGRPDAQIEMGMALSGLGNSEAAAAEFLAAGKSFGQHQRYAEAAESFRRAVAERPDHAEAYFWMGVAYARLGRQADAVEVWREAARLDPDGEHGLAASESINALKAPKSP